MAEKKAKTDAAAQENYERLRADVRAGTPQRLYAFCGEEKFLLEAALRDLRGLIPPGTEEFNHTRLAGAGFTAEALSEAVNTLPAFSERTLCEVWDADLSKNGEELVRVLSDIPDYATVVFVFDTAEFKLDGRTKAGSALKSLFTRVEFARQPLDKLVKWVQKQFAASGKAIGPRAAERLCQMTGFSMTAMKQESAKLSSSTDGPEVTVEQVEALVSPVPEAAIFELTDAVLTGSGDRAMEKLGDLFAVGEPAQRVLFSVSQKLRQTLAAKVLLADGAGTKELMRFCDIRYEFQARALVNAARRLTRSQCVRMTELASQTALLLNSASRDDGELLTELILRLFAVREGAA